MRHLVAPTSIRMIPKNKKEIESNKVYTTIRSVAGEEYSDLSRDFQGLPPGDSSRDKSQVEYLQFLLMRRRKSTEISIQTGCLLCRGYPALCSGRRLPIPSSGPSLRDTPPGSNQISLDGLPRQAAGSHQSRPGRAHIDDGRGQIPPLRARLAGDQHAIHQ